jgi:hypothetical protein
VSNGKHNHRAERTFAKDQQDRPNHSDKRADDHTDLEWKLAGWEVADENENDASTD